MGLARDVNTLRTLMGWDGDVIVPRFVLHKGRIVLVRGPYTNSQDLRHENGAGVSPALHQHLRNYDGFYFRSWYESPPVLGRLVIYKLLARLYYTWKRQRLLDGLMETDSEAMQVSKMLIQAMAEEVNEDGKAFLLVFVPVRNDLTRYKSNPEFHRQWEAMTAFACPERGTCIDLMEGLRALPPEEIDAGYDGTHYGPRANAAIAEILWEHLRARGLPALSAARQRTTHP